MLTTRTDIAHLLTASPEAELARMVVNARSAAEMQLALGVLRAELPESELLDLANVRESLADIPVPVFRTGAELSILERAAGWECEGRSFRTERSSGAGLFGLEFVGDGNAVEEMAVWADGGRLVLHGEDSGEFVSQPVLDLMFEHDTLLDAVVEALRLLGVGYLPRFHMSLEEFTLENVADGIAELNGLF